MRLARRAPVYSRMQTGMRDLKTLQEPQGRVGARGGLLEDVPAAADCRTGRFQPPRATRDGSGRVDGRGEGDRGRGGGPGVAAGTDGFDSGSKRGARGAELDSS